jgi:hypothetical protein
MGLEGVQKGKSRIIEYRIPRGPNSHVWKDYLNIGALRAHFPTIPIIALSATLMPNVLAFVCQSLQLRQGRTRLYRLSVDRPNITHMVSRLPTTKSIRETGETEFSRLSFLIPAGTTALWRIPKSMVFVDNIDEAHKICLWLNARARPSSDGFMPTIARPFSSNLETSTRDRFMDQFRNGETRILVCTDAAGMGVHVPDVMIVVQWKLSDLVTMAALWQRLGRAGRNPAVSAISVVFADSRFFLAGGQDCPEKYRGYAQGVIPGDSTSSNSVRDLISTFYKDKNPSDHVSPSDRVRGELSYALLDPAVLFYINTLGCRCRAALATFADPSAYVEEARKLDCCDNSLYSDPPAASTHKVNGVPATLSVRHCAFDSPEESLLPSGPAVMKPSKAQITAVRRAIDSWVRQHWPRRYSMILPAVHKEELIGNCMAIHTVDDLAAATSRKFSIPHSALQPRAQELVECIVEAVRTAQSEPEPETIGSTQGVGPVQPEPETIGSTQGVRSTADRLPPPFSFLHYDGDAATFAQSIPPVQPEPETIGSTHGVGSTADRLPPSFSFLHYDGEAATFAG